MNDETPNVDNAIRVYAQPCELVKPEPRTELNIRQATSDNNTDFDFIDALQKKAARSLGFMYRQTLQTYIAQGKVIIAESQPPLGVDGQPIPGGRGEPVGYCIGTDKYHKRETVGVIYQVNVAEVQRRSLIGAVLVQAMFERAAWGCRLFSCWCRQDLDANYFWESLGFLPIAFRAGSESKNAVHIFWQKRIREGDTETPYWFPSRTSGGAMRADRIVLPMPPGSHWSDVKPLILPGIPVLNEDDPALALPGAEAEVKSAAGPTRQRKQKKAAERGKHALKAVRPSISRGGLRFPTAAEQEASKVQAEEDAVKKAKKKRAKVKKQYHPQYLEAARDLCAAFLEELQMDGGDRLLAPPAGKYDVSRQLDASPQCFSLGAQREQCEQLADDDAGHYQLPAA
ncbi:MAG: GNAT family N-acetyltransferase [Phycisphaerales bacterium]